MLEEGTGRGRGGDGVGVNVDGTREVGGWVEEGQ